MSTGKNIQYLRNRGGYTQEAFAEQLGVSRQTISKWESDSCYPEMDKLVAMCDLFHCRLDDLVRGDVKADAISDTAGYDAHMNTFSKQIAAGVALVLAGVSSMLGLYGIGLPDAAAAIALFIFLIAAVAFFVLGAMQHDVFLKKHPEITPFYSEAELDAFAKKFPVMIVVVIATVLLGVVFLLGACALIGEETLDTNDRIGGLVTAGFMLFITAAAPIFTYAGIQNGKYHYSAYNAEKQAEKSEKERIIGAVGGSIMLLATIIFLIWGLMFHGWAICWITYPVGALLIGVFHCIYDAVHKK